jgi:hypothetical protein
MSSLIVPIDVAGLAMSQFDAQTEFAAVAASFENVRYTTNGTTLNPESAVLIDDCLPAPFDTENLLAGVHLHWALPAQIAQGTSDATGKIVFPAAPNRWLVARITGGAVSKAWIVESDTLSPDRPHIDVDAQNSLSRAVPMKNACTAHQKVGFTTGCVKCALASKGEQPFSFLGRVFPFETYTAVPNRPALRPFTALGYGTPSFAAAYPHCRNVFGCYDPLDGPDKETVSYAVVGWYANLADDPVSAVGSKAAVAAAFATRLGWDGTGEAPDRTICSGVLRGVTWNSGETYLADLPQPGSGVTTVTIGSTVPEAVAALLASTDTAGTPGLERLLHAFQLGLLNNLDRPDANLEADEAMHQSQFGSRSGGSIWLVEPTAKGDVSELGSNIADLLGALNNEQRTLDAIDRDLETLRTQIHLDWCAYMDLAYIANNGEGDNDALNLAKEFIGNGTPVFPLNDGQVGAPTSGEIALFNTKLADRAAQATIRDVAKQALDAKLGTTFTTVTTEAPRYWTPNDPVILVSHKLVTPSTRYGTARDTPASRLSDQLPAGADPLPASTAVLPDAAQALVAEAILAAAATSPDGPGVATWTKPWIPLFLQWRATASSAQPVGEGMAPGQTYSADVLSGSNAGGQTYALADSAIDVALPIAGAPPNYRDSNVTTQNTRCAGCVSYDEPSASCTLFATAVLPNKVCDRFVAKTLHEINGTTTLAARTGGSLASQLAQHPELAAVADAVKDLPAMAQSLSGFNASLLTRKQELVSPVFDSVAPTTDMWNFSNVVVAAALKAQSPFVDSGNEFAPAPLAQYDPLRAVTVELTWARVIDAFGRILDIPEPKTVVASSLRALGPALSGSLAPDPQTALLPPRIVQGARLLFRWLTAGSDLVETNSHPASSPIFGWLIYNHLDSRLAVYDASGKAVGSLGSLGPVWQGAPGNDATWGQGLDVATAGLNAHLVAFLNGVCGAGDASASAYVENLLDTIDRQLACINPLGVQRDLGLELLCGRPLALARAGLRLELFGNPAFDQSNAAFEQAYTSFDDNPSESVITDRLRAGITDVGVPVRLGEPGNTTDGLVGFFAADAYDTFYSWSAEPPSPDGSSTHIVQPALDTTVLTPTPPTDPGTPKTFSLLLDPFGSVHATCGVLPVGNISIPPTIFTPALQQIEVAFLTAPLLRARVLQVPNAVNVVDAAGFPLALPAEPGYAWSWLTRSDDQWSENPVEVAAATKPAEPTPQRLEEGWLMLGIPDTKETQ